nr:DUF2851 family protein [uncultured Flavobacterium sp.]
MKEDFLHYIWQYKKYNPAVLKTVQGDAVQVIHGGQYLQQSGPDFFNAQLVIGAQRWAGNVEIHVKSSDWYLHRHESDLQYDNVVLHVVWEHDTEVLYKDGSEIPVLELRNITDDSLLNSYERLTAAKNWIPCEKELSGLNAFVLDNWKERLFFERLERKALPIMRLAKETAGDWEAVLFCFLAKNFGLNTNGGMFFEVAKSLPFSMVRKESFELQQIEALLFGRAGMLPGNYEDQYPKELQRSYAYALQKYQLQPFIPEPAEFFRHRPDNFPTIRLAQLAALYHAHQNLFSKIMQAQTAADFYALFNVPLSTYWNTHYRFDKESTSRRKQLAPSFVDLLIINAIVPFKFAYAKSLARDNTEELIALLQQLKPEKNAIMDKFAHYKIPAVSAYDSQSLLQLKNEYCNHHRCLQCAIGLSLLKS